MWKKDITLTVDANGWDLSGITASESQTKTIYNSEYTATFDIVKYYNIYDANGVGYTNIKTDSSGITYRYLGLNTKSTDDEPKLEYDNYNSNHQLTTDVYDNTTLYAVWEPVLELSASLGRAQDASDKTGISTAVTEAPLMTVRMMTSEQVRYVVSKKGYCDKITVDVDENLTEVYRLADTIESFAKYSDNLNDSYFSAGRSLDNVINVGKTAMVYSQRGKFFIPIYCIEYQQYKIPQTNVRQFEVEFTADNSKSYYWKNYKGKHEIAKTKYIISVENVVDPDETEQIHKDLKYQLRLGN